ncbi:MAG: hypothetical protein ACRD9W_10630 [Terriglobia bacterium]
MEKFGCKTEHVISEHFAAQGDHLAAQHPGDSKRIVPGAGTVDARAVTTRHSNKQSVGSQTLAETSARGATTANLKQGG